MIFSIILFLSACSVTAGDMKQLATDAIQESLDKKVKPTNEKTINGSVFVPFLMSIEEVSPNNIILKQGSQTYILFYNAHEKEDSKELYNTVVEGSDSLLVSESFEQDGKFIYLVVQEQNTENVVLTVGIGGKKMTTETTVKNVSADIETMLEILRSFEPADFQS